MYIKYPCSECDAKGQTVQRKQVTVPVPAGVEDGQTVRMGVGNKEVFITFKVEKSRYFKRDGADVHTDADISLSQALLGGTIRIQGVYEDQTIQIIPGTSSHHTVTLKEKGLKRVNSSGNGDHYIHLKIAIPKKLSEKQKALIQVRNFLQFFLSVENKFATFLLKAYAELEKDTPGQIFGITYKSDGKSSSEPISEKFTQRPKDEDTFYEETDIKDTHAYKKNQIDARTYFMLGVVLVFTLLLLVLDNKKDEIVNYERDQTLAEQQRQKQKSPFDEA
jgi:DnaJ-class molecular chaperone